MTRRLNTTLTATALAASTCLGGAAFAQNFISDVTIQGSLCVGLDCSIGESFGFDTIRLKENNLRIKFQDTSTSASFPSNDWSIEANDTGNGGANYLRFFDVNAGRSPFTVEAGAQANTLYVEDDGDVGIKTSTPAVDLHIVEGNTPTIRLQQDGSDGFAAQIYDIAANEANFFIRDVSNGSALFFRSKPGAPEDSIFIAADGDIGLGTDAPASALEIQRGGAGDAGLPRITLDNTDATEDWFIDANDADIFRISVVGSGSSEFALDDTGNLTLRGTMGISDGVAAPAAVAGTARLFVDSTDGDLKVIFGNGFVATIAADS